MKIGTKMALVAGAAMMGAGMAHAAMVTPAQYVMKAGASDKFEIESAKVVMGTTANPKLKSFTSMMVTDHTKSTAMVKSAATKAGLKPKPPMLDAKQTSDLAALKSAKGPARDTLYIQQQKPAHEQALNLQKDFSMSGGSAPLKMAAGQIVPVVEHHIAMLNAM